MKTLTILLLAAVAVVASGMISDHSIIDRAFIVGASVIGEHDENIFKADTTTGECL